MPILVAKHLSDEVVPVISRPQDVGHVPLQDGPECLGNQRLRRLRGVQRVHRLQQLVKLSALVKPVIDHPLEKSSVVKSGRLGLICYEFSPKP